MMNLNVWATERPGGSKMAKLYKHKSKSAEEIKAMSPGQRMAYGKARGLSESEIKRYEGRNKYRKASK